MRALAERQEEANFQEAVEYDLSDILTRLKKLELYVKGIETDLDEHINKQEEK